MKGTYNVLVLTDHTGHTQENSIYAILKALIKHQSCGKVMVASRGLSINKSFYDAQKELLYGTEVGADFQFNNDGRSFTEDIVELDLSTFDVVFMRCPRPIHDSFLHWLEDIMPQAIFINKPSGIIKTSTKAFLLNFPELAADMALCKSIEDVHTQLARFPIVLKPLREYGGRGLLRVTKEVVDDGEHQYPTEKYLPKLKDQLQEDGMLSMKYLQNVSKGDKRILVVNGEVLAASLRMPAEGSWLCNVAQGGTSVSSEVTEEELEIIKIVTPALLQQGILIYGADTLVNDEGQRVLSEINTLSIGGFPQAQAQTGRPVIQHLVNHFFNHVKRENSNRTN